MGLNATARCCILLLEKDTRPERARRRVSPFQCALAERGRRRRFHRHPWVVFVLRDRSTCGKTLPRSNPRKTLRKTSPRLRCPGMPWGCGGRKLLFIIELFAGVKDAVSGDFLAHVFFLGRCLDAELHSPGRRGWLSLRVSFLFPRLSIV